MQYEGTSAPVRFYWFSDRIEIRSPGGLYGQCTEEMLSAGGECRPDYRNHLLAHACKHLGYVEQFGSGIPRARAAMRENGNPDVEFKVTRGGVSVVFRPANG